MAGWFSRNRNPPPADPPPPGDDPPSPGEDPPRDPSDGGESSRTSYSTGDPELDARRVRLLIESLATVTSRADQDGDGLLALMVDRAVETVGGERGFLFRCNAEGKPELATARSLVRSPDGTASGRELPLGITWSRECVQKVLDMGRGEYLSGNDTTDFDPSQSMIQFDIRSVMCVPLEMQPAGRGALYVDARASERPFARGDLRFFEAFANMLAIVLRQRQALAERLSAERMARDLQLARQIQADLLPAEAIRSGGYSACGRVVPAEEAGGDYYDFFALPDGRLALAVGDVSGHGAGPALIMSGARSYLRSTCESGLPPGEALAKLNRHLVADTDDDLYMSMFLGLLDPRTQVFRWANAGHPPAMVLRADGTHADCTRTGMALGVVAESEYGEGEPVRLGPGDAVVLFTDGMLELRRGEEAYGRERLLASLRARAGQGAEALLAALFDDIVAWSGSDHPGQDDLTAAVLRRDP